MFTPDLITIAEKLITDCKFNNIKIGTAESCTGGLIAGCLTSISGASSVFDRGYNTYSNDAKIEMLKISTDIISRNGAVSENVAIAMCEGVLKIAPVQLTVAVTGIAGPGGGTKEKPVGTVHIASARIGRVTINKRYIFKGDRNQIRMSTIKEAIKMMIKQI